jgi:hypothetical protein
LIWLWIGTGGGHLWMWNWTFRFHKMWGISWLATDLFTSKEGLCSTELVCYMSNEQKEVHILSVCIFFKYVFEIIQSTTVDMYYRYKYIAAN